MTPSHLSGAITTALIHGAIAIMVLGFSDASGCGSDSGEQGKLKMTTIEAALAYKSKTKSKQPQKRRKRAKRQAAKPDGVSRDETKKAETKKTRKAEPEEDFSKAFEKYKDQRQRDDEEDEEIDDLDDLDDDADKSGGEFDGSEHGFAEVSKGDPYMQELAKDMYASWELPTLEKGSGAAVGCVRLEPGGKISDIKLETKSGNSNIDRSVRVALKKMQKQRNKKPAKVPRHLMEITTQWTCFKLKV